MSLLAKQTKDVFFVHCKGQLISKCPVDVIESPKKKQWNFLKDFCSSL